MNDSPGKARWGILRAAIGWRAGFFIACLIHVATCLALDPSRTIHQYNCQTWSQHHGLPASGVNAVTQTADGYVWLGTSAGLVRFDGDGFTLISTPSSSQLRTREIISMAPRREGGLWAGIKFSGYGQFNGKWTFPSGAGEAGNRMVPCLIQTKDGELWIGGATASILSEGREKPMLDEKDRQQFVLSLAEDTRGRIWAGTQEALLCFENGTWSHFTHSVLKGVSITALAVGPDGDLWVGTDFSLFQFNARGELLSGQYPNGKITSLLVDRRGTLWAGTFGPGLMRFANGVWSTLKKTDGLADNYVLSLAEDREGSIWIGTRDGLSQLTDVKLLSFGMSEGLGHDTALSVSASPRGGVWISTPDGAWRFDGKKFSESYSTNTGISGEYVQRTFEDSRGDVYLLSGGSTIVICANGQRVATHTAPGTPVALMEDAQGVIVSIGSGLYRVGRNFLEPYPFANDIKPDLYWTLNLANGQNGSLLAATVNGVFRIRGNTFEHWSEQDGLGDSQARWVLEDEDGTLWAGLATGIARIRSRQIRKIGREDGLPDATIGAMVPDGHGRFWVDSNRGIFSVTRKELNDFADGMISNVVCVSYQGLGAIKPTDKYTQEQSGCRTSDGRIWFPGARGAIMINPSEIHTNLLPPIVHIQSIRANGSELQPMPSITVPPGRGELAIGYAALSYIAPHSLRFKYRLEGYDLDWVDAGDRRLAFYANLKPGLYTFHVVAANADGVWNERGDSMSVELLPHFHQTVWFYSLCGGLLVAALLGIYAWRVRHLKCREAALRRARDELEREVEKRTAELARVNASLRHEEHQLKLKTQSLQNEVEQRTRMQREIERVHRELVQASRVAGMAEVATGVLHNVGNVLNSVNVSTTLLHDRMKQSKVNNVGRAAALMQTHKTDLGEFLTRDPKGRQLPDYLARLAENLATEQAVTLEELAGLQKNVGHIKEIVAMQQNYAKVAGVTETVKVVELVEDALRMNESALVRHSVQFTRDYDPAVSQITVDRHKVIQILINLIRNAKYACDDSGLTDKRLILRVQGENERVQISVIDNGVGIPRENLTRIFSHGFTTRKTGHGFGLHSGALAAKELGGTLLAYSEGPGKGARFTLDLPLQPPAKGPATNKAAESEAVMI